MVYLVNNLLFINILLLSENEINLYLEIDIGHDLFDLKYFF